MTPALLSEAQYNEALLSLPGWRVEGRELVKEFHFSKYLRGIAFVQSIAIEAEAMKHHPDLLVRWRKVEVRLTTHSAGGITALDIELAQRSEAAANAGSEEAPTPPDADTSAPSSSKTAAPAAARSWRDRRPGDSGDRL